MFMNRVHRHVPMGKDSEPKILGSETMNREELIRFVEFLLKTQDDLKKSLEAADERIAGLLKQIEQMAKAQNELLAQTASLFVSCILKMEVQWSMLNGQCCSHTPKLAAYVKTLLVIIPPAGLKVINR